MIVRIGREDHLIRRGGRGGKCAVGDQLGGIGPPAGILILAGIPGCHGVFLEGLDHILPQGHGGRRRAYLGQEPVVIAVEHDLQRGVVLGGNLQQAHISGGPGLVISHHDRQKFSVRRLAGRIGQPLPGIYKIVGFDRYAVRPMCAAQLEGIGHGTVVICFLGHAFGNSVCDRVLTGGVQRYPHQVLV